MSALDDVCGCGDYSCGQCFNGEPDAKGNAWEDQLFMETYPGSPLAKWARDRLVKYGMIRDDDLTGGHA